MANHLMPISEDCDIAMLIGYNCPRALAPVEVIPPHGDGPYAQKTVLGRSIVGMVGADVTAQDTVGVSHAIVATACNSHIALRTHVKEVLNPGAINKMLERDFNEDVTSDHKVSHEGIKFMSMMKEGVRQCPDGHYKMPLPFRSEPPPLVENKKSALVRLRNLQNRFRKDPQYYEQYAGTINGLIDKGYAELAGRPRDSAAWFLPHHGVYHPKKPGKLRVVFDGSARHEGHSLNDYLLQGPDLTNSLVGVLCRFRIEPVALVCDIEAMFHQFRVTDDHRDFLRFLWWPDGDYTQPPSEYRMTVHLFGATSSPSCANYGLRKIADDYESIHGHQAAEFLRKDFYVDDGLKSLPTEEAAIQLASSTQRLCEEGGLYLHKFMSNSRKVLESISAEDRATGVKEVGIQHDLPLERTLGIQWCIESDSFQFHLTLKDQPLTRRGILSTVSSIYDPLGFIAPVTLIGKGILQEICREGKDWDEPLSDSLHSQYEKWRTGLCALSEFCISRCFKPKDFGTVQTAELHLFSDASTFGYGQCTYLRLVNAQNRVHCALVMGKSRVAPLKAVTIPRLELTAAVVSAKMGTMISKELQYQNLKKTFWTDSKVVLGYVTNEAKRFHVFVVNRVQQIRERSDPQQWQYVATANNPADVASRGMMPDELIDSSWLTGPKFLWENELPLHVPGNVAVISTDDPEVRKITSLATKSHEPNSPLLRYLERFSNWSSIRKTAATCLKARDNFKALVSHGKTPTLTSHGKDLTVEDLRVADLAIVKLIQQESFPEELEQLMKLQPLKPKRQLYKLDVFISDGVMRVGGRLKHGNLPYSIRHPAILPKEHHISKAIILHYHSRIAHQGRSLTISGVRSNGFWIIGISKSVARLISRCVTCRKLRGELQQQRMADLPQDRIEPGPPFTNVGVDYFGPWYVKEGRKEVKRYGALFTCLSSRAVHIEVAKSLDTDSFINALRRFISIRGPIRLLRSNRGTNFVGAQRELKEALQEMDEDSVKRYLMENHCDFTFNPPSSSHMGGAWERQIRTVRSVLSALLSSTGHQMDDEMLRTVMHEASAIVNSRPLSVDSLSDQAAPVTICPNNILTGKSSVILPPPGKFQRADLYCKRRWRRVQHVLNEFWHRWKREYVQQLQQRQKWPVSKRNLAVDDIVLLKDDSAPRCSWKLCRVIDAPKSGDGLVRKVKLLISDSRLDKKGRRTQPATYLERPVQKLVLLLESAQ